MFLVRKRSPSVPELQSTISSLFCIDQTRCWEKIHGRPRMLTCDLFAVDVTLLLYDWSRSECPHVNDVFVVMLCECCVHCVFTPYNDTYFHSKLLLDNSACFASWRFWVELSWVYWAHVRRTCLQADTWNTHKNTRNASIPKEHIKTLNIRTKGA